MQSTSLERVGQIEQRLLSIHKRKFAFPQFRESAPGRLPMVNPLPKLFKIGVVHRCNCIMGGVPIRFSKGPSGLSQSARAPELTSPLTVGRLRETMKS